MEEIDLKDCWKCGGMAQFVAKDGHPIWSKRLHRFKKTKYVSCEYDNCMDYNEVYTIKKWEDHERPMK